MSFPTGLPFSVRNAADRIVITIHADAARHAELIEQPSHHWIRELTGTVELDFSLISQVSSVLVAWIFHLVQSGRSTSLVVSKANRQVVDQLRQVYLDRFVTIS